MDVRSSCGFVRRAPEWVYGFALFSRSLLSFLRLEYRSQTALAMPLAKSFASFPVAIVFLFTQSLAARMLDSAWSGHGHCGISAHGIRWTVHARVETVHHAFAADVGIRSGV